MVSVCFIRNYDAGYRRAGSPHIGARTTGPRRGKLSEGANQSAGRFKSRVRPEGGTASECCAEPFGSELRSDDS